MATPLKAAADCKKKQLATVVNILKALHRHAPLNIRYVDSASLALIKHWIYSKIFVVYLLRTTNHIEDKPTRLQELDKFICIAMPETIQLVDRKNITREDIVDSQMDENNMSDEAMYEQDLQANYYSEVLATEEYMALYLDTEYGEALVRTLYQQQPGLCYQSTFGYLEVSSYVRERLTIGTNLYNAFQFVPDYTYFSAKQLMVFAFLAAADRKLVSTDLYELVRRIFWPTGGISRDIEAQIDDVILNEEASFDSDFVVLKYLPDDTPVFHLPSGYENKVLAPLYIMEDFAFFKMPKYTSDRGECSPLVNKLPPEVRDNVFKQLYAFKQPVEVVCQSLSPRKYGMVILLPSHMRKTKTLFYRSPRFQGLKMPEPQELFALSATNRENHDLVRTVFFKYNKIVLPRDERFNHITAPPRGMHVTAWLRAIGPMARWFLTDLTFKQLYVANLPYTEADPGPMHDIFTLIGESCSLQSLVIEEFYMYGDSKTCKAKAKKGLKVLSEFRGVKTFRICNDSSMETYFKNLVTRPKDHVIHEPRPAYVSENRNARDLTPLKHTNLMACNKNILQYLYVHTRTAVERSNNISKNAIAQEFKIREVEAAKMTKKQLADVLEDKGATWTRGAQELKVKHEAYLIEKRLIKTFNVLCELVALMNVDE